MTAHRAKHPTGGAVLMLTAFGKLDTLREEPGKKYHGIGWRDIGSMCDAPATAEKEKAQWFLPSTYREYDGRHHDVQRLRGDFHALAVDVDKGNLELAEVLSAVTEVLGWVNLLIYSTSSAAPDDKKWRVLIPLADPISGDKYKEAQRALFDLLAERGVTADRALERPGQPIYLPNVPAKRRNADGTPVFYQCYKQNPKSNPAVTGRLDLDRSSLVERMAANLAQDQADEEARAKSSEEARERLKARKLASGQDKTPIEHFNANHSVEEMLEAYGYERNGSSANWRSPNQSSGSYATRCYGDYWISLSETDAALGFGHQTKTGALYGDAFDLYCHYTHRGDQTAAIREYANRAGLNTSSRTRLFPSVPSDETPNENAHNSDIDPDIAKLARLPAKDYEEARAAEANNRGWRKTQLDKVVAEARTALAAQDRERILATHRNRLRIIDMQAPYSVAEQYLKDQHRHESGISTLFLTQGEFFEWTGPSWRVVNADEMRSRLYGWLDSCEEWQNDKWGVESLFPFEPTKTAVDFLLDALRGHTYRELSGSDTQGWLTNPPNGWNPRDVISVTNGLLHLPTGVLEPHTPAFFSTSHINASWDCDANAFSRPERFINFLKSVITEDQDKQIALVQEMLGYLLTADTKYQTGFMLIGPKRSGKGTLGRIIKHFLGDAMTAPTISSLASQFGRQPMINKLVAELADVRLSRNADFGLIAETLLSIIGEDPQTIPRKFLPDWNGFLPTRFVLMSNAIPRLQDNTGVLSSRFLYINFDQSFYGKEDRELFDKLIEEKDAILHWAVEGWRRLQKNGRFTETQTHLRMQTTATASMNPMQAFIERCCEVGTSFEVTTDDLTSAFNLLAEEIDVGEHTPQQVGRGINREIPSVTSHQRSSGERFKKGIRLKQEWRTRIGRP